MPSPAVGVWQLPAGQTPQTPWVSRLRPFMLARPDQFRPGPPPDLTSKAWARDFHEVKTYGRSDSPTRTAEQTDIARFWSTNAIVQYNTAFAQLTQARGLNAVQSARLFAMGNLIGADALIACFDAKYHELFWRPQFAIPQGDTDAQSSHHRRPELDAAARDTQPPRVPGGARLPDRRRGGSVRHVLRHQADRGRPDEHGAEPDCTRRATTSAPATWCEEIVNARVWGGVHYRQSVETRCRSGAASRALGAQALLPAGGLTVVCSAEGWIAASPSRHKVTPTQLGCAITTLGIR